MDVPCLDLVHQRYGVRGMARIEAMLRDRVAPERRPFPDPLQRPTLLHVPGLARRPWHDPSEWPWAAAFEDATEVVRAELEAVRAAEAGVDSWEAYGDGWLSWALYRRGEWNAETTALAPVTTALIRRTHFTRGEFMFSELRPGGLIPLHSGGCNAVFSCHLPLVLPDRCGIRVGMINRRWEIGEVLIFDDSYVHMCWNDSDATRIVLVWEIWHPGLTDIERDAIGWIYDELVNAPSAQPA